VALGIGAEGNAVSDRMADEIVHRGIARMIELEAGVVQITDQQALAFEVSANDKFRTVVGAGGPRRRRDDSLYLSDICYACTCLALQEDYF
jgi:hypothetical protein